MTERYSKESDEIITFEHINLNGINPHNNFIELTNLYGIIKKMGTGVYSFNKHSLNTSNKDLMKRFWDKVKHQDKFAKVAISSNKDAQFKNWQPGGTMIGCAGNGQAEFFQKEKIEWEGGAGWICKGRKAR